MELVGPKVIATVAKHCDSAAYHYPINNTKPSSVLSIRGILYLGISCMNYGDVAAFNRQHNVYSWIAISKVCSFVSRGVRGVATLCVDTFVRKVLYNLAQNNRVCRPYHLSSKRPCCVIPRAPFVQKSVGYMNSMHNEPMRRENMPLRW